MAEARRAIASVWSQEASKLVSALVRERPLEQLKPNRPKLEPVPGVEQRPTCRRRGGFLGVGLRIAGLQVTHLLSDKN
jgi:hypothetical protein